MGCEKMWKNCVWSFLFIKCSFILLIWWVRFVVDLFFCLLCSLCFFLKKFVCFVFLIKLFIYFVFCVFDRWFRDVFRKYLSFYSLHCFLSVLYSLIWNIGFCVLLEMYFLFWVTIFMQTIFTPIGIQTVFVRWYFSKCPFFIIF